MCKLWTSCVRVSWTISVFTTLSFCCAVVVQSWLRIPQGSKYVLRIILVKCALVAKSWWTRFFRPKVKRYACDRVALPCPRCDRLTIVGEGQWISSVRVGDQDDDDDSCSGIWTFFSFFFWRSARTSVDLSKKARPTHKIDRKPFIRFSPMTV
jgi:hypothetical protein